MPNMSNDPDIREAINLCKDAIHAMEKNGPSYLQTVINVLHNAIDHIEEYRKVDNE